LTLAKKEAMPRKIDWDRDRKRALTQMWRSQPLEGPYREPSGSSALRGERELQVWFGDVRLEDDRFPETCFLKLDWKTGKKQTVVYHFIGITFVDASAAFPSKEWTESDVEEVLKHRGWRQKRFQKEHPLERRSDINVFPAEQLPDARKG
jgi:hypothetical protein